MSATEKPGKGWRYQPVIVEDEAGTFVSLCEVHIAADDTLESWSTSPSWSIGDDVRELTGDLCRMLVDALAWVPVRADELRVGMTLERAITKEQRIALAEFAQRIAAAGRTQG